MAFPWHDLSAVHSQGTLSLGREKVHGSSLPTLPIGWYCCRQNPFRGIKKIWCRGEICKQRHVSLEEILCADGQQCPLPHTHDAVVFTSKSGTENAILLFGSAVRWRLWNQIIWVGMPALPLTSYVILSTLSSRRLALSSSVKWGQSQHCLHWVAVRIKKENVFGALSTEPGTQQSSQNVSVLQQRRILGNQVPGVSRGSSQLQRKCYSKLPGA